MILTTKETNTKETGMGITTQGIVIETNPHGITKAKEITENNPPGEAKEEVTH